ncbi:MAG TPA: hypothetical protein VGH43_11920 [Jatrophihabitans sp.]|jgi:hypothetical protein
MTATKQSSVKLPDLRIAFRNAVRAGESGATQYAAWKRAHVEQSAAIAERNRENGSRITRINERRTAERAFLVPEARCLVSNRELVGRSIGANVGGQPVTYTAAMHDQRVRVWRERLSAYLGYDCSDVEPGDMNVIPYVEPDQFTAEPMPAGPREYGAELEAAVTESE